MAERAAVRSRYHQNVERIEWAGLLTADTGEWIQIPFLADKTFQISGAPGVAAATVSIQGTNELAPSPAESIVSVMDDIISNSPLSALAPLAMGLIGESPLWIRPIIVGGDGGTNLKVVIVSTGRR